MFYGVCFNGVYYIGFSKEYQFVIAPRVIRFNHDEVITVSIFGNQTDVQFLVILLYRFSVRASVFDS